MTSRGLNILLTVPDVIEGDEQNSGDFEYDNLNAESFIIPSLGAQEEGIARTPYRMKVKSNIRHKRKRSLSQAGAFQRAHPCSPVNKLANRPLREFSPCKPLPVRADKGQGRSIVVEKWKPKNGYDSCSKLGKRRSHKNIVIHVGGSPKCKNLTQSVLGQVLDHCLDRRKPNRSLKYNVVRKGLQPSLADNVSGETSTANKSTSLSKEEHFVFPSLGEALASQNEFERDQFVIKESEEETMLHDYWQKKDEIEEKYKRLQKDLEVEEAAEISLAVGRVKKEGQIVKDVGLIKEYYANVKSLLSQQKIIELEELLSEYQSFLGVRS